MVENLEELKKEFMEALDAVVTMDPEDNNNDGAFDAYYEVVDWIKQKVSEEQIEQWEMEYTVDKLKGLYFSYCDRIYKYAAELSEETNIQKCIVISEKLEHARMNLRELINSNGGSRGMELIAKLDTAYQAEHPDTYIKFQV